MLTSGSVLVMVLVTCTFLLDLVCDDTCVVFLEEDMLSIYANKYIIPDICNWLITPTMKC